MTSSPRKALAPAERSSERGETSELSGVYLPPYLLGKLVPVTSAFPGPSEASEPLGAPSVTGLTYPELSSPSAKRPASQTELRSSKSRRDSPSSRSSYIPTSSTGAQFTPASLHNEPKRASSRARASTSEGPKTLTHNRESHARKRLPGRPRKNPFHPADLVKPAGTRVDEDGDSRMCVTSPHHTTVLNDVHERFPFINAFQVPVALEHRPTGPAHSHGHTGASIPNNPSLVAPSPSFSPREVRDLHSFTGRRSAYQPPRVSPSNSSITSTPRSPTEPLRSSSSSDALYGLPGVPIPLPPYPILPAPAALASQRYPVQPSVEADGYIIIRNAISPVLIRDVLTSIDQGLPVFARWDTAQTYATPIQAFKVRDEFVLVRPTPLHSHKTYQPASFLRRNGAPPSNPSTTPCANPSPRCPAKASSAPSPKAIRGTYATRSSTSATQTSYTST